MDCKKQQLKKEALSAITAFQAERYLNHNLQEAAFDVCGGRDHSQKLSEYQDTVIELMALLLKAEVIEAVKKHDKLQVLSNASEMLTGLHYFFTHMQDPFMRAELKKYELEEFGNTMSEDDYKEVIGKYFNNDFKARRYN